MLNAGASGLEELVRAGRRVGPSAAQRQALRAQLSAGWGWTLWSGGAAKVIPLATALVGLVGGGLYLAASAPSSPASPPSSPFARPRVEPEAPRPDTPEAAGGQDRARPPQPPRAKRTQRASPSTPDARATPRSARDSGSPLARSKKAPREAKPSGEPLPPRPPAPETGDAMSEARLLLQARRALSRAPQRAWALLQRHAREYPASGLEQERELLRVQTLEALGRASEARAAAEAFRARYPDAAYTQHERFATSG